MSVDESSLMEVEFLCKPVYTCLFDLAIER